MDAQALLTADHNRVRGLFARFKSAEQDKDMSVMLGVAGKIVEELEIHTTVEEEIYYPAIEGLKDEVHDLVAEGLEEHHVAKQLMDELSTVEPAGEEWTAKVKVLIEAVEHHAGEEEKDMFPKVAGAMSSSDLDALGERLLARKIALGAPEPAIDLTKEELLSKARAQGIPGRSKMSREQLAMTVDPR